MNLKEATKILKNLVMYCRFNEEKNYTDEQLFNAIEYFAFNKFIPVEKIANLKSKYKEKYEKHKAVADKLFEEVGTRHCFDNELAIRDLGSIRACDKLLEDK